MNIFDALSARKGNKLREVNMSAMLAFFLDPKSVHGFSDIFLQKFLYELLGMGDLLNGIEFRSDETVVKREVEIGNISSLNSSDSSGKRYLDVVVHLCDEDGKLQHVLIVENKVRSTGRESQLMDYYQLARKKQEYCDAKITMVFLTPIGESEKLERAYSALSNLQAGDDKKWIRWNSDNSIQSIIRNDILKPEAEGMLAPINEYTRHTLKAFTVHLQRYHLSKRRQLMDAERVDDIRLGEYEIEHRGRAHFYVFERDSDTRVNARQAMRSIAEQLDIPTKRDNGEWLKTSMLGRKILDELDK